MCFCSVTTAQWFYNFARQGEKEEGFSVSEAVRDKAETISSPSTLACIVEE